jgi:hypothetical protein
MAKRKLTARVKEQIKKSPFRVKQSDFTGEALKYLRSTRTRRKTQIEKERESEQDLVINDIVVPRNSNTYQKVKAAAMLSGMTLKAFVKKNKAITEQFVKNNKFFTEREADQLKQDVEGANKIFVNGKEVTQGQFNYRVTRLKNILAANLESYRTLIEGYYDSEGNYHVDLPDVKDYADLDPEEMEDYLESKFENITFYKNTQPKKRKNKNAAKGKNKPVRPGGQARKKGNGGKDKGTAKKK